MKSACLLLLSFTALWGLTPEEKELKDEAGKTIARYAVSAPAGLAPTADPRKQVGIFLCFPEHDRPTGDEMYPVQAALARLGLTDQFVVIGVHPQGQKFNVVDHEPIQKVLAWAKKTYPINPRRVYLYGKGEGGKISGQMAMLFPDLFAASISYSWSWWLMPSHLQPFDAVKEGPEIYMVLGMRDLAHHLTNVRDGYSRVQAKGYHVIYREVDDLGARTYHPLTNDDAIAWAVAQRNKRLPLSAAEKALLARGEALDVVGGFAAGEVVRQKPTLDNIRACAKTNCGEAALTAIAKHATDPNPALRRATLRTLAINGNWRSAAAQAALIDLALRPQPHADRLLAVDALGQSVRLQINGVKQDPPVFAALVKLLKDEDEELRTMAANILAPLRDRDFRGDLGRPEKKSPDGGWDKWLETITATNAGFGPLGSFPETLKAANQGDTTAAARLGMLYAVGNGVEQNFLEAEKWLTKAAEAGHRLAARNLSMMYRGAPGLGGKADLAKKWTAVADGQ